MLSESKKNPAQMDKEKLTTVRLIADLEGDTRSYVNATRALADRYFREGNLEAALREYRVVFEKLNDRLYLAITHRKIGDTKLSEFKKALEHYELYLAGATGVRDKVEEQQALLALGQTYYCLADTSPEKSRRKIDALAKAKKAYSKSMSLCNSFTTKDIPMEELMTMRARLLLNQGQVLVAQEEIQLGIDLLEKAIKICAVNNLIDDLHRAHVTLGVYYERLKNVRLAVKHLDFAAKAETPSTKGNATLAKAELFLRCGNWAEARKVLKILYPDKSLSQSTRHQLEKWRRISMVLISGEMKLKSADLKLYKDLGDAAAAAGCYEKALEYYKGMLSIAERNKSAKETAAALLSLAQTSKVAGLYEEALKYGRKVLKMCNDKCEAFKSALFLAKLSETIRFSTKEICKVYELAQEKAVATGNTRLEITALKEYVDYLENSGSGDPAKVKQQLEQLQKTAPEILSQRESTENPHIGADVDLDDLSDLEETETTNKPKPQPKQRMELVQEPKQSTELVQQLKWTPELVQKPKQNMVLVLKLKRTPELVQKPKQSTELVQQLKRRTELVQEPKQSTELVQQSKRRKTTEPKLWKNAIGETHLHVACKGKKEKLERVKELLANGHPTNVIDNGGWTPLHEAVHHGFYETVVLLLDAKADINDPGNPENGGVTPLLDAAATGHLDVVNLLIDKGADVSVKTKQGETILDILAQRRGTVTEITPAVDQLYKQIWNKLLAKGVRRREITKRKESAVTGIDGNCSQMIGSVNVPDSEDNRRITRSSRKRMKRNTPPNSLK